MAFGLFRFCRTRVQSCLAPAWATSHRLREPAIRVITRSGARVSRRFSSGLQFNASYTWSKSIDYNSINAPPTLITVQNSYDIRNDRGLSDFDARHRLVVSGIYELPFKGNQIKEGWQLAAIAQVQSGNPVNIITTNSTVNGVANTLRPDVAGPVEIPGRVDRWFDTSAFTVGAPLWKSRTQRNHRAGL